MTQVVWCRHNVNCGVKKLAWHKRGTFQLWKLAGTPLYSGDDLQTAEHPGIGLLDLTRGAGSKPDNVDLQLDGHEQHDPVFGGKFPTVGMNADSEVAHAHLSMRTCRR